jgi:hypothetical protein
MDISMYKLSQVLILLAIAFPIYAEENNSQTTCNNNVVGSEQVEQPGVLNTKQEDGSTLETYSTGSKRLVAPNNCNANPPIQPYIFVKPPHN